MTVNVVFGLKWIRRRSYEIFLTLHIIGGALVLAGSWYRMSYLVFLFSETILDSIYICPRRSTNRLQLGLRCCCCLGIRTSHSTRLPRIESRKFANDRSQTSHRSESFRRRRSD